jgi:hypothetical protein
MNGARMLTTAKSIAAWRLHKLSETTAYDRRALFDSADDCLLERLIKERNEML